MSIAENNSLISNSKDKELSLAEMELGKGHAILKKDWSYKRLPNTIFSLRNTLFE